MATQVVMPQMGESIAEGTVVRWIKKVGDKVDRDEPLFEISTDKVDAEIPAPAAGVVSEIRVKEGETVPVNSVVAVISAAGETAAPPASAPAGQEAAPPQPSPPPASPPAPSAPAKQEPRTPPPSGAQPPPLPSAQADGSPAAPAATPPAKPAPASPPTSVKAAPAPADADVRRQRSSPLVRRIAKEHDIDIAGIQGTGLGGRVTKDDILGHLGQMEPQAEGAVREAPKPETAPAFKPGESVEVVPMSVMRKRIAEHMIASRRTSAHVHSVFEVNFSRIDTLRRQKKEEYERAGAKLTFLSFIAKGVVDALRAVPVVNASVDGDNIVYKRDINLGIAVALDWGLIVPVVKNADEKNILGLSRAIADLAERARTKRLKPEEVQGGTFTITNPGVFGALFGMPIINQPQVAILGVGNVEKRAIVLDDAIAIRPMAYLTLGYDHRIIDGAVADQFMSHLKKTLENFDPAGV
jgi:pyruvate dehydrogenase E2 component (dihydrolipoamide acetyltransferase)